MPGNACQDVNAFAQSLTSTLTCMRLRVRPLMHQDFKELLSAFNAGQVRYLIVGGYAVSFHAQPVQPKFWTL